MISYFWFNINLLSKAASANWGCFNITCKFEKTISDYSCETQDLVINHKNMKLVEVFGTHLRFHQNVNVTEFIVTNSTLKYWSNDIFGAFGGPTPNFWSLTKFQWFLTKCCAWLTKEWNSWTVVPSLYIHHYSYNFIITEMIKLVVHQFQVHFQTSTVEMLCMIDQRMKQLNSCSKYWMY